MHTALGRSGLDLDKEKGADRSDPERRCMLLLDQTYILSTTIRKLRAKKNSNLLGKDLSHNLCRSSQVCVIIMRMLPTNNG